ncbi:hypothetical protein DW322_19400 [Rhodococcus rhodnii]|uniref:Uncharacterized protein n=2 Tax=Rhodococcus rhodnii TaxID=38312 RepID=R7WPG3_9NOCA|nr:Rid family hydrolase [Rhodococcus rhodnii]EOM77170.1 hypothetical protein Rrhod_1418 [Rhodococcus rhodnii LMG 5362]TXG91950.1 hypothetical protein DW322_19400 [Rhodococcus rhodnii]
MRTVKAAAAALAGTAVLATAACSSDAEADSPAATAKSVLEVGEPNPMIAEGVTIGPNAYFYKSSGLGPASGNSAAESGTPEAYIDTEILSGGELPEGVTVTEAQGIGALRQIRDNLESQGLTLGDVVSMRVFLDAPPGADRADYAGWNRAYRQFFANTNLDSGETELVPMGTGEPAAPLERNEARPSRFALEVASLPVPGWLVEVEVDAVYPEGSEPPMG